MQSSSHQIVLGSRSPRRLDLLASIVGRDCIAVCAPTDAREQGFADCHDRDSISHRLSDVVNAKRQTVIAQIEASGEHDLASQTSALIVADTIVVVRAGESELLVLGQPDADQWKSNVRQWMQRHLSGQVHEVWTRYSVVTATACSSRTVTTCVEMEPLTEQMIDWYLATGESVGKAGGYAIQGHASAFIRRFDGSITNVIGLPVYELAGTMQELGVPGIWHHDC